MRSWGLVFCTLRCTSWTSFLPANRTGRLWFAASMALLADIWGNSKFRS